MLLLLGIVLATILALEDQYADGNHQRIIHISELIRYDDDFSSSGEFESTIVPYPEDDNSHICCVYGNCTCNSLDHALANLTSNVLINITTDVTLSSFVERWNLQNVSIIGHNNPTLMCKNGAGIKFMTCHNCIIYGIAWNKCGTKTKPGLMLNYSSKLTIQTCSFQRSLGQVVVLSEVSGDVNIKDCNFMNNNHYRDHGTAVHYSSNNATDYSHFVFDISNCNFINNRRAKSLIYIKNVTQQITLCNSTFHHNKGVSIYLVNHNLSFSGKVLFQSNAAKVGTAIYISDHSTVVFGKSSNVTFIHNSANREGGAIYLRGHSSLIFDQNCEVKFNSNIAGYSAGGIYSYNGHIIFKGNSTTEFNNNTAYVGGALRFYNSHVTFEGNSTTEFNNNTASYGGALQFYNSHVTFEGNSTTEFNNNTASYGGALRFYNSHVTFEGNSTTKFSNNTAIKYGAAASAVFSDTTFDDDSKLIFTNNKAPNGTIIYSRKYSKVTAKAQSNVVFNDLPAKWCNNTCLPYTGPSDVVIVDSNGVVRCNDQTRFICQMRKCHCKNFEIYLNNFKNNSLVNITDTMILSSATSFNNLNNISIIGHNNPSVYCVNSSGLTFIYCKNIVMKSITWIGCGYSAEREDTSDFPNLSMSEQIPISTNSAIDLLCALNIMIQTCTFQYSKGPAIALLEVSGEVNIVQCDFVNNINYRGHGAAIHYSSNNTKNSSKCLLKIDHCSFAYNGFSESLVYIESKESKENNNITFYSTKFYHNQGASIHIVNQLVYLNGKVLFQNNIAKDGSGIYITDQSTVMFGENSDVEFTKNIADHKGSAVFLQNHSTILFNQNSKATFHDNNGTSGTIYSESSSNVIFTETCQVTFSSNSVKQHGSAIYSFDNSSITFKVNATVTFKDNHFTTINRKRHGGTIFSEDNSNIYFEDNSATVFSSNTANFGAAVFLFQKSNINFKDRSMVTFNDNKAIYGGAIALYENCNAAIEQFSNLTFTDNVARQCGGALYFSHHCHFSFIDNSVTLFANNRAEDYGGAVYGNINATIKFVNNSTIIFENNTASFGENLYSTGRSSTDIRNANLKINNNTARWYHHNQYTNIINDIVINTNGIVRCSNHIEYYVCQYEKCFCENIEDIPSDVVVIITDNITLSSMIPLLEIANISLIGYNSSFIHCKNDGGLQFTSCSNVSITNLTWHKFINNERKISNDTTPQIIFYNSSNVIIDHCTFQQSVGQAIILSEMSGNVNIKHCKFVNNKHTFREYGAAIHYSSKCTEDQLIISDCHFTNNSGAASLIYLENHYNHNLCESIILQDCEFKNNQGVCICLSNQNLYIKGNALFENNVAKTGTGISITAHSNVTFAKASNLMFVNNTATINGGAIYVDNWSSVVFENDAHAMFTSNKATRSGGTIYSCNNSGIMLKENSTVWFAYSNAEFGGTFYIEINSFIITKGGSKLAINNSEATYGGAIYFIQDSNMAITENSTVEFYNNKGIKDGGCIYSESNCSIVFSENSITTFYKSKASNGGAIYSYNSSGITLDKTSQVWFNHSTAEYGGTLYIEKHSYIIAKGISMLTIFKSEATNGGASYLSQSSNIIITEDSTTAFLNGEAKEDGGSIYSDSNSSIIFKGNSTIKITSNKATQGGAIYSGTDSNIQFDNSSTVIFNINEATYSGGCIFSEQSTIQFKGTCTVKFKNSVVFSGEGGAIFCRANSKIMFISCNVTFHKNTIYNGEGGAICCTNSIATFEGTSNVKFDSNKATNGGAANFDVSSLIIRDSTVVTFHNNSATMGGAVNFHSNSNGTFEMNSTLVLRDNSAQQNGGALHTQDKSHIEFKQFVSIEFGNNNAQRGGAIFLMASISIYKKYSTIMFRNNTASQDGGALYIADHSQLTFMNGSNIVFSHNSANDYGGAMYSEVVNSRIDFGNSTNISFFDNIAETTGNSVYMNLPRRCNSTCLTKNVLGTTMSDLQSYIITSPNKFQLHNLKFQCIDFANDAECDVYYIKNIMLGEKILLDACMYDYYDHPVDVARFLISGTTDNQGYHLDLDNILITCNYTLELISIYGNESTSSNYSIQLSLYDNRQSESKEVMVYLIVELSPCHPGFSYQRRSQKCDCYNASDIVFCSGRSSTIKRGYWFGNVTGKPTVTFCPINYCNFTCCETSNGYYHLSPVRDNQCRSHRSGIACGSCSDGYTLSFDSTECVDVESCTAGYIVLVILLSIVYWIVMVMLVFAMMYYKVGIGYLYGITYYYSIVDILLAQNLYASREIYLTVSIMSSFSKIIPQFLGELCLTTGTSGIDQQFIHYIHPSAVILILGIISLLARVSQRISAIISRGIIHVICLLLLLSYTSVASTSLLLMRPLIFDGIDKVYTYLSPDIEYFHDRHLAYGIVALLCIVFIVIGLPLLLTLEPFLNRKFNFIKIKPLLDQFQGCYKDQYRWFAGYYMICRLVIIAIVITDLSNEFVAGYILIIVCGIIDLIHISVKPYSNEILNKFDSMILHLVIFIAALPLFDDFNSPLVITIAFLLVILPLLNFFAMAFFLHKNDLKRMAAYFTVKAETNSINDANNNEIPMEEFYVIVDDNMRRNATICDM